MLFAEDRVASYKQDWGGFYESGGVIVANRYTTSNAVHQASKLPEDQRWAFLDWLFDFEYRRLSLPEPDLVIYLHMPAEVSAKMIRQRSQETGAAVDIHEQDQEYLRRCQESALDIARKLHWAVIDCAVQGRPRSPQEIQQQTEALAYGLLNGY